MVYELNTALFSDYALKLRTFICPKAPKQTLTLRIISLYPLAALSAKPSSIPKPEWRPADLIRLEWDPGAIQTNDFELMETR